jgi:hypothetical protein
MHVCVHACVPCRACVHAYVCTKCTCIACIVCIVCVACVCALRACVHHIVCVRAWKDHVYEYTTASAHRVVDRLGEQLITIELNVRAPENILHHVHHPLVLRMAAEDHAGVRFWSWNFGDQLESQRDSAPST